MAATKAKEERKDQDTPELTEKTVTVQGIKVTLDPSFMGHIEAQELLDEIASGANPFAIVRLFRLAFGEQYGDIKKKLSEKHDPLLSKHMEEFLTSALKKATPNS